jgi:hypothetical protein
VFPATSLIEELFGLAQLFNPLGPLIFAIALDPQSSSLIYNPRQLTDRTAIGTLSENRLGQLIQFRTRHDGSAGGAAGNQHRSVIE